MSRFCPDCSEQLLVYDPPNRDTRYACPTCQEAK